MRTAAGSCPAAVRPTGGPGPWPPGGPGRRTIRTNYPHTGRTRCRPLPGPVPRAPRRPPNRSTRPPPSPRTRRAPRTGYAGRPPAGSARPDRRSPWSGPTARPGCGRRPGRSVRPRPGSAPRAGVQEHPRTRAQSRRVGVQQSDRPRSWLEIALDGSHPIGRHRAAGSRPGGQAAVEDPHVRVTRPAQQPPRPGRRPAQSAVVHDDGPVRPDARPPHGFPEGLRVRQRVAAARPGRTCQFAVEVDVHRPGQVSCLVGGPLVRAAELPADVQQHRRAGARQLVPQFGGGDDHRFRSHAGHLPPRPSRA